MMAKGLAAFRHRLGCGVDAERALLVCSRKGVGVCDLAYLL
jgi:hypothetical protein